MLAALLAATLVATSTSPQRPIGPGEPLPAFTAESWSNTGTPVGLAQLEGKVGVVVLFGTWAQPGSQKALQALVAVQAKYPAKVAVLGLETSGPSQPAVADWLKEKKISAVPVGYGPGVDEFATMLGTRGVHAIPTVFVLAPDGTITWMGGTLHLDGVGPAVAKALAAQAGGAAASSKK